MVITPMAVRAMIARWGGAATLRRGASSCAVLAAIIPAGAAQGIRDAAGSFVRQETQTAIIATVDADGAPITLTPTPGDRIERGSATYSIGPVKPFDPDGTGALAFVVEVTR